MKPATCSREQEVVEAVLSERWPDGCAEELRNHAMTCGVCNDVVVVARALHEEHACAFSDAPVPSAGMVWWRAELRARQEATRAAQRPMTVMQAFGAAGALGVAISLMVGMWPLLGQWLQHQWLQPWMASFGSVIGLGSLPLMVMAGAVLLIAPVALYFVFSGE